MTYPALHHRHIHCLRIILFGVLLICTLNSFSQETLLDSCITYSGKTYRKAQKYDYSAPDNYVITTIISSELGVHLTVVESFIKNICVQKYTIFSFGTTHISQTIPDSITHQKKEIQFKHDGTRTDVYDYFMPDLVTPLGYDYIDLKDGDTVSIAHLRLSYDEHNRIVEELSKTVTKGKLESYHRSTYQYPNDSITLHTMIKKWYDPEFDTIRYERLQKPVTSSGDTVRNERIQHYRGKDGQLTTRTIIYEWGEEEKPENSGWICFEGGKVRGIIHKYKEWPFETIKQKYWITYKNEREDGLAAVIDSVKLSETTTTLLNHEGKPSKIILVKEEESDSAISDYFYTSIDRMLPRIPKNIRYSSTGRIITSCDPQSNYWSLSGKEISCPDRSSFVFEARDKDFELVYYFNTDKESKK